MKNHTKTVGALAAAAAMVSGYAMAGEPAPPPPPIEPEPCNDWFEGEIHVGYNSMYEFRFVDLGQDMIEAGADVAFDLGGGFGISAGAWYASTNDSQTAFSVGDNNELDLYAGLSWGLDWVDLEVGYIFYHFMDVSGFDTQEIYASVGFELPWEIGLGLTWLYDIQKYNGSYVDAQITKSFEFTDCLGLELTAGVAWAKDQGLQVNGPKSLYYSNIVNAPYLVAKDGYQGWYASAALPWEVVENFTITPYVKYTNADGDLVTDLKGTSLGKDYLLGGVMLSVAF